MRLFCSGSESDVRPYHAMVLTESKEAVHKALPVDAAPQLRTLIDAATPTKSFSQLQFETGIELGHIMLLAAHLRFWSKAIIIVALRPETQLRVHADADLRDSPDNPTAQRFGAAFPDLGYHKVLYLHFTTCWGKSQSCVGTGVAVQQRQPGTMPAHRPVECTSRLCGCSGACGCPAQFVV